MSRDYPPYPLVGVGVVIWKADRILLIERAGSPDKGRWSLPGGGQELGETVRAAARREIREETGLDIRLGAVIDVVDSIVRDDNGSVRHHYTLIDFAARWQAGTARPASDVAACHWADPGDLERYGLRRTALDVIRASYACLP